jgi:pyrimidine operon attenuation protein/uracil phosphoribosyltransferase
MTHNSPFSQAPAADGHPAHAGAAHTAERLLLDAADLSRCEARIAHEIIETTSPGSPGARPVVLLGVPTRGVALARRLAAEVERFSGAQVPWGSLDITLYRDDLRERPNRPLSATEIPSPGVDGSVVILVDDVLFSGRSVRAALDALRDLGRPAVVKLAVLVDRGHRELPMRADYVGRNIPTARSEGVAVRLVEHDGRDEVALIRALPAPAADGPRSGV